MPRLNIEHVPLRAGYCPAAVSETKDIFETVQAALADRARRAKLMRTSAASINEPSLRAHMMVLAHWLGTERVLPCGADPVHFREVRRRVTSNLWHFLETEDLLSNARMVTIIPRDAQYRLDELMDLTPKRLSRALRSILDRHGAKKADGCLILWLEADYDPRTGIIQFHWHGIVAGGMIKVVRRLKRTRKFASERAATQKACEPPRLGARVVHPIKVSKPLDRQPRPILYCLKRWWWAHPTAVDGDNGNNPYRVGKGTPLRGLPEAYSLVWHMRWRLADLTLMMGMYVGCGGFALSK